VLQKCAISASQHLLACKGRTCERSFTKFGICKDRFPLVGRGGPWGCETARTPQFLDNRLRDGLEVCHWGSLITWQRDAEKLTDMS
jgi:hypothetical protein